MRILLGSLALYDSDATSPRQSISDGGGAGTQWLVDTVAAIRAAQVVNLDRGNASDDFSFTVHRIHGTPDDAVYHHLMHRKEVGDARGGAITYEFNGSTYTYTNGQLKAVASPKINGVSTWTTYQMCGGYWTVSHLLTEAGDILTDESGARFTP